MAIESIRIIDPDLLEVDESIEFEFIKKDVDLKHVSIHDITKLEATKRYHDEADEYFLTIKVFEGGTQKGFTTYECMKLYLHEHSCIVFLKKYSFKIEQKKETLKRA